VRRPTSRVTGTAATIPPATILTSASARIPGKPSRPCRRRHRLRRTEQAAVAQG
jgi:hypothetical protein